MKNIGKRIKYQISLKFGKQMQFSPKIVWFDGEKINYTNFLQNLQNAPKQFQNLQKSPQIMIFED